jgi:hypothetical protein
LGTSGTNPHGNFEMLDAVVRPRQGLSLNAGLGGPDSITFIMHLRGIGHNREEHKQMGVDLEKITLWLVAKENWESPVSGYVAALT